MRKHLLGLMLIAGLAGCTSESDSDLTDVASNKAVDAPDGGMVPTGASLAAQRGSAASFASLPDRGELMAYGGVRKSRQSGAYTYHPVAISEAHALNAIGRGELVVATPDGEPVRIKYERHEEQPDGNWTWIGRNADGTSAVLTFGEKAVFGMISRGDDYYRVRTDRTGAWVVATDRGLVAAGAGRRADGPDALLPPEAKALTAAAARHLAKAGTSASTADPATKAAAVVDVLIGYSNGLASAYGGQSAATTFVTSLAALTNTAYANSGIGMRLRVVRAMQVNYSDTSDNKDALHQLTGYDSDTNQPITPNSAFSSLRSARDEYGADLVAFVRRYREPEQDGCGIAWLLGMNQSGISAAADAEFGYAVVSDGEDRDETDGNTYFCSDLSLAHELGHLMGQAHNTQDAQDGGAHTYSYGYRESSATGFHTIMAYPSGSSQVEIPNFANPQVSRFGRPTGVANQSDNARSMNITMPVVSTFRATVVPVEGLAVRQDVNRDGKSDILWRQNQSVDQNFRIWLMNGTSRISARQYTMSANYRIVATGDFNGDGRLDIIWREGQSERYRFWLGTASGFQASWVSAFGAGWEIAGTGDVNGDGKDDIFFRQNQSAPQNFRIWLMNGTSRIQARQYTMSADYSLVGSGDLNGDGRTDLLWRAGSANQIRVWTSTGAAFDASWISGLGSGWRVVDVGDVDGDDRADIMWRSSTASSQNFSIWYMDGLQRKLSRSFNMGLEYSLVTTGDFNGDGRLDLVWRSGSNTDHRFWMGTGTAFNASWVSAFGSGWTAVKSN
jgi:hypothetical protein